MPNENAAAISHAISKYCSKTLKQLDLDFIREDTFKHLTTSFDKVKELTFGVDLKRINAGTLSFNKLMPKLLKLKLKLYTAVDYSFINVNFRNLRELHIFATVDAWTHKTRTQIEGFFKKNPKITTIYMSGFPDAYISSIKKLQPNLQSLSIDSFDITEPIRFDNVKHFGLSVISATPIDKLSFPQLDSVQMGFYTETIDQWLQFFRRHQKVRRLFVDNAFSFPLVELTANLANLNEVTLQNLIMCSLFSVKHICEFIQGHTKMTKLQLLNIHYEESDFVTLRERLENDWRVVQSEYDLLIERKVLIE